MLSVKWLFIILLSGLLFSCKKDTEIKNNSSSGPVDQYSFYVPEGWPDPVYKFDGNPVSYDGFMLGRYLFYENMLSLDSTISCGSCHQQNFAFTNGPSHKVSHGVNNLFGKRNAPALFNLNWNVKLMWDGSVNNLENQPIAVIQNPLEFAININTAVDRLAASPKYKTLFSKVYGDTVINSQRMLKGLAQFLGMLMTYNSKYDKVKRGEEHFTASENSGYAIFKANCAICHTEPLFSDFTFRNKGLPVSFQLDSGRYAITGNSLDMFRFKVPSLRNLAFTAPYMHDGRYNTLDEVFTFFTSGVANTPNLDPFMAISHNLSEQERGDLLNFLATLNDYSFVTDPRFKEIH